MGGLPSDPILTLTFALAHDGCLNSILHCCVGTKFGSLLGHALEGAPEDAHHLATMGKAILLPLLGELWRLPHGVTRLKVSSVRRLRHQQQAKKIVTDRGEARSRGHHCFHSYQCASPSGVTDRVNQEPG